MLEKLLAEIRAGGTLEVGILAARLGATPEMVAAMLDHLQRSGYLKPYQSCDAACVGCGLKKTCQAAHQTERVRLWQG